MKQNGFLSTLIYSFRDVNCNHLFRYCFKNAFRLYDSALSDFKFKVNDFPWFFIRRWTLKRPKNCAPFNEFARITKQQKQQQSCWLHQHSKLGGGMKELRFLLRFACKHFYILRKTAIFQLWNFLHFPVFFIQSTAILRSFLIVFQKHLNPSERFLF